MRTFSLVSLILTASVGVSPHSGNASAPTWERVFDGKENEWPSAIAATGQDAVFVGGAWGISTVTSAGTTIDSTHGHGVLGLFVESSSSVYAVGEGELISHFDGKKWSEEHVGFLPPRNQRRLFSEHMLYRMHFDNGSDEAIAFGVVLVLVKQPNGTWAAPPQTERDKLLETGAVGPELPNGPSHCDGRAWHWFGRDRAFFSCDDHRAFIVERGRVTPKGKVPRQCGSTVGALAYATGEVYATCGTTLWKTYGGTWRRIEAPNVRAKQFSSIAFADDCIFIAGGRTVWRSCGH